jgi:8-oxo-dGTP pyrophosphatase MutT (NUDIX family)
MRDAFSGALAAYEWATLDEPGLAEAAVMVLLYPTDSGIHTVLQKRSELVLHHKGQISFPGGARDPEDVSLEAAALRETHEEIGVHPDRVQVIGRLDEIRTISGFRVAPFVGWFERGGFEWKHSAFEVAYLIEAGIDHLAHPRTFVPDIRTVDGKPAEMPSYRVGDDLVWGATARIVANFLDVLTASGLAGRAH